MRKKEKEELVFELKEKIARTKGMLFVDFRGLKTIEISSLRKNLKENKGELKVVKNSLILLAIKTNSGKKIEEILKGPTAFIFGFDDIVPLIKLVVNFKRKIASLKIKGAILEDEVFREEEIEKIASLPSKEELIAKIVFLFNSPLIKLINILINPLRQFIYVLEKIKLQKEENNDNTN